MKDIFMPVKIDPYKILFPLGILHALSGTTVWILFAFNLISYPGSIVHPNLMINGFLFSFALGFLMTAVPRFTGAKPCTKIELLIATILSVSNLFFQTHYLSLLILIFISLFFIQRFFTRAYNPPTHFIFLPIGLILGITGALLFILIQKQILDSYFSALARVLLYQATMLSFLLGIGAKLITALLGWTPPPVHQLQKSIHEPLPRKINFIPFIQGFIFLISYLLEINQKTILLSRLLRAFIATWIAVSNWKIYKKPKSNAKLSFWLWIASLSLVISLWLYAFFTKYEIHFAHLIFILGFGLITFMIASRVTLAHGGYPLEFEIKSKIYALTGIFFILSGLTRASIPWTTSVFHHYAYAASTWILGILIWSYFFLKKIIIPMPHSSDDQDKAC